jgi:hypothetical protein
MDMSQTVSKHATGAGREWLTCTASDLTEISVLGRGAFGKVLLVKHKASSEIFALKCQVRCAAGR